MKPLLKKLEKNYLKRCGNYKLQKSTWKYVVKKFPPVIGLDNPIHPSLMMTKKAGDLGLSILWIVQATLINSQINEMRVSLNNNTEIVKNLNSRDMSLIGSLAHSEDNNNPVIANIENDGIILNGLKKYITGGKTSDFILLTARIKDEKKISRLFYIPVHSLPQYALKELELNSLKTTSHSTLSLNNYKVPQNHIINSDPSDIRRSMKKWGIIERSMIVESYIGLLIYLDKMTDKIAGESFNSFPLEELLISQQTIVNNQIKSALNNKYIELKGIDFSVLPEYINKLKDIYNKHENSMPLELKYRFNDLNFMGSMKTPDKKKYN